MINIKDILFNVNIKNMTLKLKSHFWQAFVFCPSTVSLDGKVLKAPHFFWILTPDIPVVAGALDRDRSCNASGHRLWPNLE